MRIHAPAAATLAWLLLASGAAANDLFVNNVAGNDRSNGSMAEASGVSGGPFRTITRALRSARKGDRIILADTGRPYRESITLQGGRHSGYEDRPLVLVGNGAVLDGSRPVPADGWEHASGDMFRYRPDKLSHQQLFLDGRPCERVAAASDLQLPELQPLQWCYVGARIYFRVEKDRLPHQYDLTHTALRTGITLYEVRNVQVQDLIVQGFQLDGVNAHDGVFGATLVGLTCRGNGRSGISVGGASRVTIEACLIGDNGEAQVRTEGWSKTRIVNCDILEDTAPAVVRRGGEVSREAAVEGAKQ